MLATDDTQGLSLIRSGETTTLSLPLNTEPALDNPVPADHHMTMLNDVDIGSGTLGFAKDYIGADYISPSMALSLQRQAERLHHR